MSFAYMPFYTGDYHRDTRHLSLLQHGAYRLLLDHCWDQRGPLPLVIEKCFRICGAVSKEEQDAVRSVIDEFFVCMEDGHYNRRIQKEIERCNCISAARSEAGKAGYLAKAKQLPSKSQAIAKQVPLSPSPSPSSSLTPSPAPEDSEPNGSGAKAPDQAETIFGYGVPMLTSAGTPERQARSFLGKLRKAHGDDAVIAALRKCYRDKPLQPVEYLGGLLPPAGSVPSHLDPKQNKRVAQEMRIDATVSDWVKKRKGVVIDV